MSFLIDLVVIGLLAGTVAYVHQVDRRLRNLMRVLRELEPVIGQFSAAVDKSESSIGRLKGIALALPGIVTSKLKETGPESEEKADESRANRERPTRPAGATRVAGKSELVRGFFETARGHQT